MVTLKIRIYKRGKHFCRIEHLENLLNSLKQQFPSKLTLLKKIKTKIRRFELPKAAKNVLLIVVSLLIFDALVAVLGAPYLSKNIGLFLGKSRRVIVSDLLFLEGTVTFAIGTFIAISRSTQEKEPSHKPSTQTTDNEMQTHEKWIPPSKLMMITGAILIGVSIINGTLLP